jgi:hypothetical protein
LPASFAGGLADFQDRFLMLLHGRILPSFTARGESGPFPLKSGGGIGPYRRIKS